MFTLVRQLPFRTAKHKSVNPPSTPVTKNTTTRITRITKTVVPRDELVDSEFGKSPSSHCKVTVSPSVVPVVDTTLTLGVNTG